MSRKNAPRKARQAKSQSPLVSLDKQQRWLQAYFASLERLIEQTDEEGRVSELEPLQCVWPHGRRPGVEVLLWVLAEMFRISQLRDDACPGVGPLFYAAAKLNKACQLTNEDINILRRCLFELRNYAALRPPEEVADLILTARIKLNWRGSEAL